MHEEGVERAGRDQVMAFDAEARVEQEHREALAFGIEVRVRLDVEPPVVGGALRGVAELQLHRCRAVAQGDHLELLGLRFWLGRAVSVLEQVGLVHDDSPGDRAAW